MWHQLFTVFCVLIYLNNSSESYVITTNTTTEIGITSFNYHNQQNDEEIEFECDPVKKTICETKRGQTCQKYDDYEFCVCNDGFVPSEGEDVTLVCKTERCTPEQITECFGKSNQECHISGATGYPECACKKGYEDKGTGGILDCQAKQCPQEKITECMGKTNQECHISKTTGYPECACKKGYEDKGAGGILDCQEIHVCRAEINPCPSDTTECVENEKDYYCNCLRGYVLENGEITKNKGSCQKKTVCNERKDVCPPATTKCVLKEKNGYYCDCLPGYKVPNNVTKENNKEDCIVKVRNCKCQNGDCVQKKGKIECQCWPNYGKLSETKCVACNCGEGSSCIFDWQSHRKKCICKEGYRLIGGICVVDECASIPCPTPSSICRQHAKGNFYCECATGYKKRNNHYGTKEECIVDLCRLQYCPRNSTNCIQIEDKDYFCVCKKGYKLKENMKRESNKEACLADCVPECVYGECEEEFYGSGSMKCRCDENFEGPACNKMKLIKRDKFIDDFVFLIVSGVVCFFCVLISIITLVIVCRKFKMIKK